MDFDQRVIYSLKYPYEGAKNIKGEDRRNSVDFWSAQCTNTHTDTDIPHRSHFQVPWTKGVRSWAVA